MTVPKFPDPFEQAFFDYLSGKTDTQLIVHNSKGDDETMPVRYFFRTYEEMPELEKIALKKCIGNILDIGAGSGCHSLYLQKQGWQVTALDIRPGFVKVMQRRGIKNVVNADIQDFNQGKFDTLLMLMNGIGFTLNFDGLERFLNSARDLLVAGGQILLDSSDLLYMYKDEHGNVKINLNEDYYGEVEYQVEYKGKKGIPFNWLFVDFANLSFIADQAGFRCELLYEDESFNYLARLY